ncbi:hypothetical protein EIP91_010407 [Steccherinum ochraceum]|uniref:HNH nuclease domain-containing protein n=1 Tax=Steccherinum ochraceum TaxID=92696 RepID=A0A4R0R0M8_9APHY|nr:hypothetical protein EIP91_010407 [Steccherinum ochraceum]
MLSDAAKHLLMPSTSSTLSLLADEVQIDDITSTRTLSRSAHFLLTTFGSKGLAPTRTHQLDAERVLRAMLDSSKIVNGTRFVASAIIEVGKQKAQDISLEEEKLSDEEQIAIKDDKIKTRLTDLASDWAEYLLFSFFNAFMSNGEPSTTESSPTIDSTRIKITPVSDSRSKKLREEASSNASVLVRDNLQCVLTGTKDANAFRARRIRPTGKKGSAFVEKPSSVQVPAAIDMLKGYACLSDAAADDLLRSIDDPTNAFLMVSDWHDEFDHFTWCLVPSEVDLDHMHDIFDPEVDELPQIPAEQQWYNLVLLEPLDLHSQILSNKVTFRNHAPPQQAIKVPNPKYLAIHAAIAHALLFSGAGQVFAQPKPWTTPPLQSRKHYVVRERFPEILAV